MKCLPSFQKACQWINEGKIGDIELVRVDFYKREHIREGYAIFNASEGGGILRDFGVYAMAFMEHFLGGYPNAIAANKRISIHGIDADWNIVAEKNGVRAFVNLSANFGASSKAEVIGSNGFIEWDAQFNRTNRVVLYDANGIMVEDYIAKYNFEGFEHEVKEVNKCINADALSSKIANLNNSYNVLKIIENICLQ